MAIICQFTVACRLTEHFALECPGETAVYPWYGRRALLPDERHTGNVGLL